MFSSHDVLILAGISYRSLDYWIRQDYIPGGTPGTGVSRSFDEDQVLQIMQMAALVNAGVRPEVARQVPPGQAYVAEGLVYISVDLAELERRVQEWLESSSSTSRPAAKTTDQSTSTSAPGGSTASSQTP